MPVRYEIEKIIVEKPRPGEEPFFGIHLQKVETDAEGNVTGLKARHDVLYLKESDLASDEVDIHDPITDEDIHISGDGAYFGLLKVCKDMVAANKAYALTADGDLVDE